MSELEEFKDADHPTNPVPAPTPVSSRKPFPKSENPKNEQFTARANDADAAMLWECMEAQKRPGEQMDIVVLCCRMIEYLECDILQTFKTRVKGFDVEEFKRIRNEQRRKAAQ